MKPSFNLPQRAGALSRFVRIVCAGLLLAALLPPALAAQVDRSILKIAAAGVGLPPAGHDFTRLAAGEEFVPNHLLVRFAPGVKPDQRNQILGALGGAQIVREYELVPGLCLLALPAGQTVPQALLSYNGVAGILYAEPDYIVRPDATFPNDARFSELWGMWNTGQTGGTPGADIRAPNAWDSVTGSRQIRVAVIDTGVDYTHSDLTNNMWINPGEIPGNGLDDDNNGYVDDVHGYDFYDNEGDPMDEDEHGTHCSGTIGGEGNNAIGVAGVCWQVRIMAVRFLGPFGGSTADGVLSVQYATLMGANVMNNSWGGGGYSQALKDAIDAAGAANIVFAAAAGNSATDNDVIPHYPSSYDSPNIIAVMSTDHYDTRSGFSCWGLNSVDLAAPGSQILSCQPGDRYQTMSGTSMSTPHVSGAAALLFAANPTLRVAEIKQAMLSTVDPVVPGLCVSGGRLNLERALHSLGPRNPLQLYTNYLTGGNGNGMIDFNECNNLSLVLTNVGTTNATGIRATLSTTTPGVIIAQPTSTYFSIPVGGSGMNQVPFKVSTTPSFVCGIPVDFTVVVKSDQSLGTNHFRLATGSPGFPVRFDNSTPVSIPDMGTASSVIVVSNITSALNKVAASVFITHTFDWDLIIQLISPDNTTNLLSASNGGSGNNYGLACSPDSLRTTFDDDAPASISAGFAPFVGLYKPQVPLSIFTGKAGTNINGTWRLRITDQYAQDVGALQCWSLLLTPADCKDGGGECPGSDLALAMVAQPQPVVVGGMLTYTITVTNHGPSIAGNVQVTQLIPPAAIFVSANSSQGTVSQAGGVVTANVGTLAYRGGAVITVVVMPAVTGTLSSTASANSNQPDPDPSNNSATVVSQVNPVTAELAVGLAAAPASVVLGGTLTYTVSVTNNGPSAGANVTVTNVLPAGAGVLSATVSPGGGSITPDGSLWTVGSLASGARATATIVVVPSALGTLTATATVSSSWFDPFLGNNVATVSTPVGPAADLAIGIADSPDPVVVSSNLTYWFSVTNSGPSAANGVQVSGLLPAGVSVVSSNVPPGTTLNLSGNALTWLLGTMNSGARATLSVVVRTTVEGPLSASASVAGVEPDPNPANNSAGAATQVSGPFVSIIPAGATLAWESGPTNGAVDPGETVTVNLRLRNVGNISTPLLEATLLAATGVTPISGPPPLAATNSQTYPVLFWNGQPESRPFSFVASATNGNLITATLQLQDKNGTNTYPSVSFNFTLPTVQSVANAASILIPDPAAPNPPYPAQSGPGKPYPSVIPVSNLSGVLGKVTVTLSNLWHTYPGDVNALLVGPSGAKTLLMSHAGTESVTNLSLTFDDSAAHSLPVAGALSSGVWRPTAYGSSPTFPANAPAGPYPVALSTFNGSNPNGAWSLYVFDDEGGDKGEALGGWSLTFHLATPVNQLADIGVSVVDSPDPAPVGGVLTYAFTVANTGPSPALGVAFTNVLPTGVTLLQATSSQGTVITNASTVLANLGALNSNATATVTVAVRPLPSLLPSGGTTATLTSAATAGSGETDPNPANNTASAVTTINLPVADLGVTLTNLPNPAVIGYSLTNIITVTNLGPGTALSVVLTNPLPAGAAFVPADSTPGSAVVGSAITCALGDLAPNTGTTVFIVLTPSSPGLLTNTVTVTTGSQDVNLANNSASCTNTVKSPEPDIRKAGFELTYESGPNGNGAENGLIDPNETVTLNFWLTNAGSLSTVNLKATLLPTNGVTSPSGPRYYGALVTNGPAVSQSFSFTAAATLSNGLIASLQLQDERPGFTNNNLAPVTFEFGRPSASNWTSTASIIIPDQGVAAPYPSSITVSNLPGVVVSSTVTLKGLVHSFPRDVSALLVSPEGASVLLMSHTGGGSSLTNGITLTFDDAATASLSSSGPLASGTFRPTSYPAAVTFPAPAPSGAYASLLGAMAGRQPNGTWSLYVMDDAAGDSGFIAEGWSLNLTTAETLRPLADLAVSLSLGAGSSFVGGTIASTIWVTNLGPVAATDVMVTNSLFSGQTLVHQVITNVGSLAVGAAAPATLVLQPSIAGTVKITASVGSAEADPYPYNNAAQASTTVLNPPTPLPALLSGSVVDGKFELLVIGQANYVYAIEASTNLQSWLSLTTNTAPAGGTFKFTDTNSPDFGQRFYRARSLTP